MAIVITDDDVRRSLTMPECIDAMRVCFRDFADGRAVSLPRLRYMVDTSDPARAYRANVHVGAVPSFKTACVRAANHLIDKAALGENRIRYGGHEPFNWTVIILFDTDTSEPVAFLHESYLSGMRVGATSALAVDEIARSDCRVLGLLGTGRQAAAHCEAICSVRPIHRVNVYSPNRQHLEDFVARLSAAGLPVVAASGPEAVMKDADIICCATNTTAPVISGDRLQRGQVVVSIVNSDATVTRREVDEATFTRADAIIINDWNSVHANKQVELLDPIAAGKVDQAHVHLLGDLVSRRVSVRSTSDNIVYYKNNTGLAMQFAAAGAIVYQKLKAEGTSRVIPREWLASERYGIG